MTTSRRTFLKGATAAALFAELGMIRDAAAMARPVRTNEHGRSGALRWRDEYTLDPSITYLNHGSIGTIPRIVQDAHAGYLSLCETNPWLYIWSDPWAQAKEDVRSKAAVLMGCSAEEVAITHNTTECFNLLAHGLPLGSGDEILFSSLNHTGASMSWQLQSERRGFTVRRFDFPISDIAALSTADIVQRYEDALRPSTRVLILPHVDNAIGLRHPVAAITRMARDKGVEWIAVDGAQSVGMVPVDVHALGVDAYATSAHKWIQSPKELGLTFIRKEIQHVIQPLMSTWGQNSWRGTVRIFEDYGTRALPAVVALGDAIDFQNELAPVAREQYHRQLWSDIQRIVAESDDLIWRSPTEWDLSAALYAVEVRGKKSSDMGRELFEKNGIVVRAFSTPELNALRVSPNIANDASDFERLVDAVRQN